MSGMSCFSSFHSKKVSRLSDERQHTAERSPPSLSSPVGRVISLHKFDILTCRPASLWCSGIARFTWSMKIIYGSPVSTREVRMRIHNERAGMVRTIAPSLGLTRGQSSSFSTARMKASGITSPWCRFSALRLGSPPVGRRISMNSSISGWDTGR